MVDITALLHPRIRDRESLDEFLEALTDQAPKVERDVARLRKAPDDKTLIADLFRALHTIKGDAAMCKVDLGVTIAHPIETLLARTRSGEIVFTDLLAEVILLAMDRLEQATEALALGKPMTPFKLPELVGGLETLAAMPQERIEEHGALVIENVTGYKPIQSNKLVKPRPVAMPRSAETIATDLRFFHDLALQYETHSPLFKGRAGRLLRLAIDTNTTAGKPVDPYQLEAAIYMHDVGMMFLPEAVWLKVGRLSDEDKQLLRHHPLHGAGLLARMEGWSDAATMVEQHHEMPDGGGYPKGLKEDEIVPGAKILAIVDAFEAVTLKHSHRGQGRSLLRAIAEINACDNQFAPEWIGPFNTVIRKIAEGGPL